MTEGCFWTNLVQAEQECGGTPAPPTGAVVQFRGSEGDGSGNGRLCLPANLWFFDEDLGEGTENGACEASLELVFSATTVEVTGYIPADDEGPPGDDHPSNLACGDAVPEDGYTEASIEMESEYNSFDDYDQWVYYFNDDEEPPTQGWYYVRLLIDGTTELYGVLRRGGGV